MAWVDKGTHMWGHIHSRVWENCGRAVRLSVPDEVKASDDPVVRRFMRSTIRPVILDSSIPMRDQFRSTFHRDLDRFTKRKPF